MLQLPDGGVPSADTATHSDGDLGSLLFEISPDIIIVAGFDGRLRQVSGGTVGVLGYPREQLLANPYAEFVYSDDLPIVQEALSRLVVGERVTGQVFRLCRRDGSILWVEWNASALQDGSGFLAIGRDCTERRRQQETLALTDAIMSELQVGYWVWERDGDSVFWSDELYRITGLDPERSEVKRDTLFDLADVRERDSLHGEMRSLLSDPETAVFSLDCRISTPVGAIRHLEVNGRIIRDPHGRAMRTVGKVRDVSEVWEAEHALSLERELVNAIFETVASPVVFLDREGRILRFNRAAENVSGFRRDEVKGRVPWECLVPENERRSVARVFEQLREGEFPSQYVNHWQTKSGDQRLLVWSNTAVTEVDGPVQYIIATGIDVTALEQARQRLDEAEERYRRLVELSFDMVMVQCNFTVVEINSSGAAMLGARSEQDLVGRSLWEFIHPDYREFVTRRIEYAMEYQTETPLMEQRLIRLDGGELDVEVASIPTLWNGRPATQTVFRDITERKQAEAALRASEQQLQTLTQAAPVGIYRTDQRGRYRYANSLYRDVCGYGEDLSLTDHWTEHVHNADRVRVGSAWERALAARTLFRLEYRVQTKDESLLWVFNQAVPEHDADGNLTGYVGTVTDITERKCAEKELEEYRQNLEAMVAARTDHLSAVNRELESFSYSVSHDLRAPLRAVIGFTDALQEDFGHLLGDEGQQFLGRIRANGVHMGALIEGLLKLSRVSRSELSPQRVDLAAIARQVMDELHRDHPTRSVEFICDDIPAAVGDPHLLQVAVENLLNNAWKYTSKKARQRIRMGAHQVRGRIVYFIEDNGAGFKSSNPDEMFAAFKRLHHSSEFEGTGIGLATVQRVIHRHGGSIWAHGVEGQGASFFFTLEAGDPRTPD